MQSRGMSDRRYHLREIPDGFQIFEERLEVAGISHRRDEARAFATGRGLSLELEREASNQHDPNAIRVIGCRKGLFGPKKHFIGYVPSKVAAAIVTGGYYEKVAPRLLKTFVEDSGFVEVLFQLLGPKGERWKYKRVDPDSLPQSDLGKKQHFTEFVDHLAAGEAVGLTLGIDLRNEAVAESGAFTRAREDEPDDTSNKDSRDGKAPPGKDFEVKCGVVGVTENRGCSGLSVGVLFGKRDGDRDLPTSRRSEQRIPKRFVVRCAFQI